MTGTPPATRLHDAYALARERYAALGVDTDQALATLGQVALSLHCWQGDDVAGFESPDAELTGGSAFTPQRRGWHSLRRRSRRPSYFSTCSRKAIAICAPPRFESGARSSKRC